MQTWHSALPVAFHNSTWIGDRTIDFLEEQSRAERSACGPRSPIRTIRSTRPSRGAGCTTRTRSTCRPSARSTSSAGRGGTAQSLEGKPQIVEHLRKIRERVLAHPGAHRPAAARADRQLLRDDLADRPQRRAHPAGARAARASSDNTLVVYSTDHGDWLGDHGLILKGPMAYEGLLRVGLLFQGPGVPKGKVVDDPVSTLDLPATFCRFRRRRASAPLHSRSLRKLIEGKDSRDFAYSEWDLRASRSRRRPRPAHRAHQAPQAHARPALGRRRAVRPVRRSARDGQPVRQDATPQQKQLTDMIRSRPADAAPRLPQVGMA